MSAKYENMQMGLVAWANTRLCHGICGPPTGPWLGLNRDVQLRPHISPHV
jgi:hypothetical protein